MKLEKGTVRTLAFVLFGAILFYWALDHWELLWNAVRLCARLTFPFFLGFCIAFVLNVPMRALEKKFWPETDKKALNALRRPMCILVSLVLILAILTAVVMLVVPELVNAFGVLADQIPVFLKNAQAWLLANGDAFPALQDWLSAAQIDWNSIGQTLLGYVTTGAGIVVGETAEIGNNVTIYHGVTLGGTGKDEGKRHPTVCDNVLIGTGCKVLGPITIGENSRIGANSVVLTDIPANATAIGIPASVVRINGNKVVHESEVLNQRDYPDVVHAELAALKQRLDALEQQDGK